MNPHFTFVTLDCFVTIYTTQIFDKHQDLFFVCQGILVMEYTNSVTDM